MAFRDQRALKERRDRPAPWDHRDRKAHQDQREPVGAQGHKAHRDQPEPAHEASVALLGRKVRKELRVRREHRVRRVRVVLRGSASDSAADLTYPLLTKST